MQPKLQNAPEALLAYFQPDDALYSPMLPYPEQTEDLPLDMAPGEPETHIEILPLGPPETPPKYLEDAAIDWCPKFFDDGIEYIERKRTAWNRLKYMFVNQMPLSAWYWSETRILEYIRKQYNEYSEKPIRKRTDEIVSISQYVLHFAEGAFRTVFSSEPWFSITAEAELDKPSIEDLNFSTAQKMENLLARYLRKAFFKQCAYQVFQWLALLGSCGGKVRWYEKQVFKHYKKVEVNEYGDAVGKAEPLKVLELISAEPVFDVIPPDELIPDPSATNSDIQRWYGVGHTTEMSRAEIIGLFESKVFTLNKDDFMEKWGEPGSATGSGSDNRNVAQDDDRAEVERSIDTLKVWEYHGLLPTTKGDIESVSVFITEKDAETCSSGILVKCHEGTALHCGLRPFVWATYTPYQGPYGLGAVEPNFSHIWMLSHLRNLLTDCLEININPMWQVVEGSKGHLSLQAKDNQFFKPGGIIAVDDIDKDVAPFKTANVNIGALQGHIQYLDGQLQMLTSVSDNTRGISDREKTASEVNYMMQQATAPLAVRLEMIAETFLDPTLSLFLYTIQQFELDDQVISVPDEKGIPANVTITAQELQSGKYSVQSVITQEDSQRIAVTQTIQQMLPQLIQYKQIAAEEGYIFMITPIVQELLARVRMPRLSRVIRPAPPQPEQPGMPPEGMDMEGMPPMGGPMPANPMEPTGSLTDFMGPMGTGSDADLMAKFAQNDSRIMEGGSYQ